MSTNEHISSMLIDVGTAIESVVEFPVIFHDVKQGEDDWHALRLGIPTGSQFSRIVTPTGKLSESRHKLMSELIAERCIGQAAESFTSAAMERGQGMEGEAVAHYAAKRRMDPVKVGFVTNVARTVGVSPDRLLGDEELLEVKCPKPENHMAYLLSTVDAVKRKSVAQEYKPQVQGQLWLTGRKRCVTLSYCPGFPSAVLESERDDKYIELLAKEINFFSVELERIWKELCQTYPQCRPEDWPSADQVCR